jgi:hypothetical protein
MEDKPLNKKGFKIDKSIVFNLLQTSGLGVHDKSKDGSKNKFVKVLSDEKLRESIDMFEKLGALSAINLAEKLDIHKKDSVEVIHELLGHEALIESHKDDDGESFYVLAPLLRRELIKA